MCHQARTSGSALTPVEQRLEPAVAARRRAHRRARDRLGGRAAQLAGARGAAACGSGSVVGHVHAQSGRPDADRGIFPPAGALHARGEMPMR